MLLRLLDIAGPFCGAIIGAYLAIKVRLATIETKMAAMDERLDDHSERLRFVEREAKNRA
jgi:hypothetical protein